MVNNQTDTLNQIFSALADPTRRAILSQLRQRTFTVSELAEPFDMSLPAISKHLRVLEKAGLINREKNGRIHYLSLKPEPMKQAADWLSFYSEFWEDRFARLAKLVEDEDSNK